jgi:hypothetical protein
MVFRSLILFLLGRSSHIVLIICFHDDQVLNDLIQDESEKSKKKLYGSKKKLYDLMIRF